MYLKLDNRLIAACALAFGTATAALAQQPAKDSARASGASASKAKGDAKTADGKAEGGRGTEGGQGGRGGGRTASVVLAATDVFKVARSSLDAGIAIAGDLRPIESTVVRSRIDGLLEKVTVRDGQQVRAGTLLAKFESVEQEAALRSAEADFTATKGDFETQQWNYDQSKELFKAGAIAERDLRTAQQTADAARARMAASESRLRTSQNVVRDTKVVAPFNGTIDKRKVQNGENTQRGAEMFTLVRDELLELAGTVPARRAGEVKVGQPVRFSADARQFTGRVARLSATIDPASRSMMVYVQVPNGKGDLKGNSFATGQIIAKSLTGALAVPQAAVRQSPVDGKSFVYTVEGGQLGIAKVQTGILDESRGLVEILSGLKEGEVVVTGNVGTLGAGMKVTLLGNEQGSDRSGARGGNGSGGRGSRGGGAGGAGGEPGARSKKTP